MPSNLGSAIGGGYNADFNTDSILKGFQLQGQRQQAGLAQQARLQAKVDKDKQNFQNQVMKYADFSKLHPLLQDEAREDFTSVVDEANEAMNSGDVETYTATFKKLQMLNAKMKMLEGKSQSLGQIDNKIGELTPQGARMYLQAREGRDIRKSNGMADNWGNSIQDGFPVLDRMPKVNPHQELLKAMSAYDRQKVGNIDKHYYDNGKKIGYQDQLMGIPPTREDAIRLGMPPTEQVLTADVLAANLFDSSPDLQKAVMVSFGDDIEKAFPDFQGNFLQSPEARAFARDKYIEMAKDEARTNYKRQGYAQAPNKFESGASGGGFSIGKNTFNFGKTDYADEMKFLEAIGDAEAGASNVSPDVIRKNLPERKEVITIVPPNAAKANMTIKGKQVDVENFEYKYSDKQGKWYVTGTVQVTNPSTGKKEPKMVVEEINDATYGGIFGVYKGVEKNGIEKLFNERLKKAGYEPNFRLKPNVPKQNTVKTAAPKKSSTKKNPPATAAKVR